MGHKTSSFLTRRAPEYYLLRSVLLAVVVQHDAQECAVFPLVLPNASNSLLPLQTCADTIVGNVMIRGVSGGQRKRVTTGTSGCQAFSMLSCVLKCFLGCLGAHAERLTRTLSLLEPPFPLLLSVLWMSSTEQPLASKAAAFLASKTLLLFEFG